jgi:hypothetical protein
MEKLYILFYSNCRKNDLNLLESILKMIKNKLTYYRKLRMGQFAEMELKLILDNEICRIANATNNIPHVIPVCYIYKNNKIFFSTDYNTKKYKNLVKNKIIFLVIDQYDKLNGNKGITLALYNIN